MSGFDPGRVRLNLHINEDLVDDVGLSCERPLVSRLLRGQPAEQAVALVPMIYSLCGKAQGIAARAVLAAAGGAVVEARIDAEAWAEAAREHAWKLFVDWPKQLGLATDEAFFVALLRSTPELRVELAEELSSHALPQALAENAGASDIDRLFVARLSVRMNELRDWLLGRPGALGRVAAQAIDVGLGEARVETARGTLLHRLKLDGERVGDYEIVAPTDIHFAQGGEVERQLHSLRGLSKQEAERQALLLALAFDPCVPWECTVA